MDLFLSFLVACGYVGMCEAWFCIDTTDLGL